MSAQGACSREEPQPKFLRARRIVAPLKRGWLSTNSRSLRHSAKRPSPKPVRLIEARYCFGMIWSVSTFARSSGTTTPFRTVNFTIFQYPRNGPRWRPPRPRSEEHTSELQSQSNLVCRLLLEKKKNNKTHHSISHTTSTFRLNLPPSTCSDNTAD